MLFRSLWSFLCFAIAKVQQKQMIYCAFSLPFLRKRRCVKNKFFTRKIFDLPAEGVHFAVAKPSKTSTSAQVIRRASQAGFRGEANFTSFNFFPSPKGRCPFDSREPFEKGSRENFYLFASSDYFTNAARSRSAIGFSSRRSTLQMTCLLPS